MRLTVDCQLNCNCDDCIVYSADSMVLLFDSHQRLKRAYDLSRGRTMVAMVFFWSVVLYLAMRSGQRLRESGYSLSEEGTKKIAAWQEQGRLEQDAEMKKSAE